MNRKITITIVATIASLLSASTIATAAESGTRAFVIRCDLGADPQIILDRKIFLQPIELYLVGTCPSFEIARDDVFITARDHRRCPGANVDGGIGVNGAHRIKLSCLSVTGAVGTPGVSVFGGTAILEDMEIAANDDIGLGITANAFVEVFRSAIRNNGEGVSVERATAAFEQTHITGSAGIGVVIEHGASVEFLEGSIRDNDAAGMRVTTNSSLVVGGSFISNNGRAGVAVLSGSDAFIEDTNLADNGRVGPGSGVFMQRNASAEVVNSAISGNLSGIGLSQHSLVRIAGQTQISDNEADGIAIETDSGAILGPGVLVPANGSGNAVSCADKESSLSVDPGAAVGPVACSDPDF